MRIPIPEVEKILGKNATAFDSFRYLQAFLEVLTRNFPEKYEFNVIDKIDDVEAGFICGIKSNYIALYNCAISYDYSSASIICRAIVDRIAILKLIFANTNKLERSYRYYLYVLDGMKERVKLLADEIKYDGTIDRDVFDSIERQVDSARENTEAVISHCQDILNNHPFASKNPAFHHAVLKRTIWKYSEFGKFNRKKAPNELKWQDLYKLIDERKSICSMYSNYLSQFVHGLSISILPDSNNFENLESLMCIATCLQYEVIKEVCSRYKPNFSDLTLQDISYLCSYFSDENIQAIYDKLSQHINQNADHETR